MGFFESVGHTLLSIHSVTEVNLIPGPSGRSVMHQNTVCFKLRGTSLHCFEGEELLLEPGGLLLLPKELTYTVTGSIEPGESIAVGFELLDDDIDTRLRLIKPRDRQKCDRIFRNLLSAHGSAGRRLECFSLFYELIAEVCGGALSVGVDPRIRSAVEYIEQNCADPALDEKRLAELCGFSVGYFRRAFTREVGKPPLRFIISVRMAKAVSLLRSGFFTVSRVAELVGYRDVYYFSASFKREMGVSPSQYFLLR